MEAPGIWTIYPNADRAEVEDLIQRLTAELRIEPPPILGDTVALPPYPERVIEALNNIQPDWIDMALIMPPGDLPVR